MVEAAGIEPNAAPETEQQQEFDTPGTSSEHNLTGDNSVREPQTGALEQIPTSPGQNLDNSSRQNRAKCVQLESCDMPSDLKTVVNTWNLVPNTVRRGILAMIKSFIPGGQGEEYDE